MHEKPQSISKPVVVFSNYDDLENPYYAGGGCRAIHEIGRRLLNDFDVRVLTGKYPGCQPKVRQGVVYEPCGFRRSGPRLGQLLFQLTLPLVVRRMHFDLWVESLTPPLSTVCLPWFTKKPLVLLTQNLVGRALRDTYRLPFDLVERFGARFYDHAIALTDFIRNELLKVNPQMNIRVIPNGVAEADILTEVDSKRETILFLGRLDVTQKGLDLLLNAYASIQDETRTPLVIAGSGTPKDERWVEALIQRLGLAGRVRKVGRLDVAEKAEAFRRGKFLVMPSRFEGFPLTALEAFCYRLPVVCFDTPYMSDLSESCCLKVLPLDVAELGRALLRLDRDRSLCESMGAAGKRLAAGYSWDALAVRYSDFLRSILHQPSFARDE